MQDAENHDVVTLENQITERYGTRTSVLSGGHYGKVASKAPPGPCNRCIGASRGPSSTSHALREHASAQTGHGFKPRELKTNGQLFPAVANSHFSNPLKCSA